MWKLESELEIDAVDDLVLLEKLFDDNDVYYEELTPYMLETSRMLVCIGDTSRYKLVIQQLILAKSVASYRVRKRLVGYFPSVSTNSNMKSLGLVCGNNRVVPYIRTMQLIDDDINGKSFLSFLSSNSLEEYRGFELADLVTVERLRKTLESGVTKK